MVCYQLMSPSCICSGADTSLLAFFFMIFCFFTRRLQAVTPGYLETTGTIINWKKILLLPYFIFFRALQEICDAAGWSALSPEKSSCSRLVLKRTQPWTTAETDNKSKSTQITKIQLKNRFAPLYRDLTSFDVVKQQSEVLKLDFIDLLSKVRSLHTEEFISGPLEVMRGSTGC